MILSRQDRQIVRQLAKTDFKLRYNGSVLGYAWSLLKPLFIFSILNFVFSNVFGNSDPNYSLRLLTSIILWTFFAEGTSTGLQSLIAKAGILTKINVSKLLIILSSTIHITITFLLNLVILVIFYTIYGFTPAIGSIIMFAYYSLLVYILILGFSLLTAPLFVRYRDMNQIWEVLLLAGFYASPIIYPLSAIPEKFHWVLHINPMTFIIQHVQANIFDTTFTPPITPNCIYLIIILFGLTCAFGVYTIQIKRINEYI